MVQNGLVNKTWNAIEIVSRRRSYICYVYFAAAPAAAAAGADAAATVLSVLRLLLLLLLLLYLSCLVLKLLLLCLAPSFLFKKAKNAYFEVYQVPNKRTRHLQTPNDIFIHTLRGLRRSEQLTLLS